MAADVLAEQGAAVPDRVELSMPADPAYLAVLRTATAGLAARLDLTLDEIEDLRIAVDEASTLLLRGAGAEDRLEVVVLLEGDVMQVEVRGPAVRLPPREHVAWAVLEALVGQVQVDAYDGPRDVTTAGGREAGSCVRLRHVRAVRR